MTKRKTKAEEKRGEEIAALEYDLRLIAYGANAGCDLGDEEDDGLLLFGCMAPEAFESYLRAIRRVWRLKEPGREWLINCAYIAKYQTVASTAEWLHSQGARGREVDRMTKRKAIEAAILAAHQQTPMKWWGLKGFNVVVAEHAYDAGLIAGLRKAAKDIKGSSGSGSWNSVMLLTKARELAKKARAK